MRTLKLTNSNYYSQEANKAYISVSQYKDFFGSLGQSGCEYQAMAIINGEYKKEPTTAMLVGSYIDSWFEGTLEAFKESKPELFKRDGSLKADYVQAESIIERIKRDKKFMQYMSGQKQRIFTGKIFGADWKCKLDSYIEGKAIVDLKIVDDIYKSYYHKDTGRLNFIQERGYDFQLAIYQKLVELNTGKLLHCYIAAADKGKTTNIEVIEITPKELNAALTGLEYGVKRINLLKKGEAQPEKCGRCDWCKETKVITKPVLMQDLLGGE